MDNEKLGYRANLLLKLTPMDVFAIRVVLSQRLVQNSDDPNRKIEAVEGYKGEK
jgi:hypothetical protein